jgi:hypothetical protein
MIIDPRETGGLLFCRVQTALLICSYPRFNQELLFSRQGAKHTKDKICLGFFNSVAGAALAANNLADHIEFAAKAAPANS